MPTQIIDGFSLNANRPIDSRMVTNGLSSRNGIQYKYEGLRVYDIYDKTGYVWIEGAWVTDGGSGGSGGSGGGGSISSAGTPNFITKFNAAGNGLTQSLIREKDGRVGINVATVLQYQLEVGGTVRASAFSGPAGSLPGTMVETASLDPTKIVPRPNDGKSYLLKCVNGVNQWQLESGSALTVDVTNDTASTEGYLTFVSGQSGGVLYINNIDNNEGLRVKPSTGQILASTGRSESEPAYSFVGYADSGMWKDSNRIGINLDDHRILFGTSTKTALYVYDEENISLTSGNTNIKTDTQINGALTVTGITDITGATTITGTTTVNGTLTVATGNATSLGGTLAVTGTLTVNAGTPRPGRVLKSTNSSGLATWGVAMDVGTIMMWCFGEATIPTGWIACKTHTVEIGSSTENGFYKIYINGIYQDVPTMCDTNHSVVTGTGYASGGVRDPKATSTNTFTIQRENLPKHTHGAGTLQPLAKGRNANGDTYIQFPFDRAYHPDYTSIMTNNGKIDPVEGWSMDWSGQFLNGNIKWDLGISGSTSDGGSPLANTAISLTTQPERYVTVLFIMKYDPAADADTDGYIYFVPY